MVYKEKQYATVSDCNEAKVPGLYYAPNAAENMPVSGNGGAVFIAGSGATNIVQIFALNNTNGNLYVRRYNTSGWSDWKLHAPTS